MEMFASIESYIIITTAIAMVLSFIIGLKGVVRENKKNEPLIEKGKKAIQERQKKLELNIPRFPLYYDIEKFDTLFHQSQIRKSSMKIESIKKISSIKSDSELDAKIIKTKVGLAEHQEELFKEFQNRDDQYERILGWLCEQDSLIIGLEEPEEPEAITQLIEEIQEAYKKAVRGEKIPKNVQEALMRVLEWKKENQNERLESVNNKLIFVKGTFKSLSHSNNEFEIGFDGEFRFYVKGVTKYCTETGQTTFSKDEKTKASVFGYVKSINDEESSLLIEPIAIHRILS